jgi:hypothetical protein
MLFSHLISVSFLYYWIQTCSQGYSFDFPIDWPGYVRDDRFR